MCYICFQDGESDSDIDDDDDELPCVLATTEGGNRSTLVPESRSPFVVVQDKVADERPVSNNSILPFVIRQPTTSTQQDPPVESLPATESSNSTLGNRGI